MMNSPSPTLPPPDAAEIQVPAEVVFRRTPFWKRLLDVVGSLSLLLLLSPLMVLVAVYIRCVSGGPVFFCQERIGGGTKRFIIYKFRTMAADGQAVDHRSYVAQLVRAAAPASKPSYEARLIPGGRILRRLSIDELPQLWNVLRGNMSLIGPRPDVLDLQDYEPWQLRRFEVLPGITGLWQVSGKNRLSFQRMVELDLQYIDQLSFWLDVKIAIKTFGLVLNQFNE